MEHAGTRGRTLAVAVAVSVLALAAGAIVLLGADDAPDTGATESTGTSTSSRPSVPASGIVAHVPEGAVLSPSDAATYAILPFRSFLFDDGTLVTQPDETRIEVHHSDGTVRVLPTVQDDGSDRLTLEDAAVIDGRITVLYGFVPAIGLTSGTTPDGELYELHTIGADGAGDRAVWSTNGGAYLRSAALAGGTVVVTYLVLGQQQVSVVTLDGSGPQSGTGAVTDAVMASSPDGTVQAVVTAFSIEVRRADGAAASIPWPETQPLIGGLELDADRMIVHTIPAGAQFLVGQLFDGAPSIVRLPSQIDGAWFVRSTTATVVVLTADCEWQGTYDTEDGAGGRRLSVLRLTNTTEAPCIAPLVTDGTMHTGPGPLSAPVDHDTPVAARFPIVFPGDNVAVVLWTLTTFERCEAPAPRLVDTVDIRLLGGTTVTVDVSGQAIDAACGGRITLAGSYS